jgi:hypothetical protein
MPARRVIACCCSAVLLAGAASVRAGSGSSDAVPGDPVELRSALDAALEQAGRLDQELARARSANAALATSLAAANQRSRDSEAQLAKLRDDLEALGVAVLDPTDNETRRRLIAAVADAKRERETRARLEQQLLQLSETVALFLSRLTETDPAQRALLEAELRASDQVLGDARLAAAPPASPAAPASLAEARVLSLNPELGLVVLNAGRREGVRLGMPMELFRNDRSLGRGIVADLRDAVCGLVPTGPGFPVEEVQVGDLARPLLN